MARIHPTEIKIIKAAQKLFAKKGYSLASMDDIARAVGIAKPSIYYYFESKEHIYARVVNAALLRIVADLQRFLDGSRARKIGLNEIINAVINDRMRDGTVIRLIDVKIIGLESKPFKEIRGTLREMRALICRILKINKVKNKELAAEVLINSIHCYVLHANHNLVIAPVKEYGDYLASLLLPSCSCHKKTVTK